MGKVIAKKIRGMGLAAKIGLVTGLTLLLCTAMWYHPFWVQAVSKQYVIQPSAVTFTTGGTTVRGNTACATDVTTQNNIYELVSPGPSSCTSTDISYQIPQTNGTTWLEGIYNTAYTQNTTVTGTSFLIPVGDDGNGGTFTIGIQLFSLNPTTGVKTNLGSQVNYTTTQTAVTAQTISLASVSGTVSSGSKLGVRVIYVGPATGTPQAPRIAVGSSTAYASAGGVLVVGEVAGDTTAPAVSTFSATTPSTSRNIPITAFTATDNVGVTGYLITTSSTQPAAGAAGWTSTAPTTYTVTADGSYTLYPWAKDAAGNVSAVFGSPRTVVVDTVAPTISSTIPANGATGAAVNGSITLNWSEAVNCTTVNTTNITVNAGTLALSSCSGSQAVFTTGSQANSTSYTVTVGIGVTDVAGNPMTASYPFSYTTVAAADTTAPTVTAFTMPATATSTTVSVSSFTATDNVGVTGYLITESATAPAAGAAGWTATAPTSFTFAGSGARTAYAWAKDAAGNVSASRSAGVTITLPDTTPPTVTAFTMPATATALTVAVNSFTATDSVGVTGYLITESATAPAAGAAGWTATAPTTFTFSAAGARTAYAWAKDAAGNVSTSLSTNVTITLPDTTAPSLTTFTMPSTATSLTVLITAFTATDNVGVTGWLVKENNTTPLAGDSGWLASQPSAFTFAAAGLRTAYAWVKDAAGNISNLLSAAVTITLPDTTAPTVTAFTMPATASSLTVAVSSLTATDNVGVTGYLITESATAPSAGAAGWTATAPTSFTFSASGAKTAYAWAKDAAGNVSASASATVTITLSGDTTAPTVTAFTMPATATGLTVAVNSFTATDNTGVTGYLITESATAPAAGAAGWSATAPTSYTFSASGAKTAYAWAKDAAGNVSASASATVTITISQSSLVHSSNNLGTKYGAWGTSYDCSTCHDSNTTNIKQVAASITTPTGARSVIFSRLTSSIDRAGVFGDDLRAAGNGSTNVCEVCHHNTVHHQYSSAKITDRTTNPHYNRKDCISCHLHSAAFKGAGCDGCHGNPPNSSVIGAGGLATPATKALGATPPANGGAHVAHTGAPRNMACNTCHSGYGLKAMPSNSIDIGFAINNGNFPGFGATGVATGTLNAPNSLNAPYTWSPAAGTTVTANPGNMTCAVYCHGSTLTGGTNSAPNWAVTDGTQDACGTCHGASSAAAPTTGSHGRHAGNGATSLALSCDKCHGAHTDNSHVDGNVAWNLTGIAATAQYKTPTGAYATTGSSGGLAPSASYGSCTNIYCHSTVQGSTGTGSPTYASPTWGGATLTCGSCHADMSGASGTGSHSKHASTAQLSCSLCHGTGYTSTTATYPRHANGFINISTNSYAIGTAYTKGKSITPGSAAYGTCSNSYCHSTVQSTTGLGAGSAVTTTAWGSGALNCGSCHKNMSTDATAPGSHVAHTQASGTVYTCDVCHGTGYSATTVVYPSHVNNQVNLSFTANGAGTTYSKSAAFAPGSAAYGSCSTNNCHGAMNPTWGNNTAKARCQKCHGYRSSGWNALNGATATTDVKAGAHFNHISSAGTTKYVKVLSCAECHAASIALTTDSVTAAGHFDTAGPADVSFGTLAKTGGQLPGYNSPAAGQCSNVYCHGAGLASNVSNPPSSRVASPTWSAPYLTGLAGAVGNGTTTPGSGDCSTCHGYPPMTSTHTGKLATDCTGCHTHVNASGTGFTDATKHINGTVDAAGDCNSCHDFDVVGSTYAGGVWDGGSWGKSSKDGLTPNEGWGAHAKHINMIKNRLGITTALNPVSQTFGVGVPANVCGSCHTNNVANHSTGGSTVRTINFGDSTFKIGGSTGTSFLFGATNPVYNGVSGTSSATTPKTCSNISCHYFTSPIWSTY
jgi:predicted CxxxxCH...CXXCH cytochrome family protein